MMDDTNTEVTQTPSSEFTPPRHWIAPEELKAGYWADPKNIEKRGQEFHEKPVEYLEMMDKSGKTGMARREFLTVMGASMAMASLSCARRPVHKIIPYVVKPEEVTPGVANYYATTCTECSVGCGTIAKNREGRPIKIEGNPDHPMNRGALCAKGQASLMNLYDPDRLKGPYQQGRGAGGKEITWTDVDNQVLGKLKSGARVRILSREINSETTQRLVGDFLRAYPGSLVEFDVLGDSDLVDAQAESYGAGVVPDYRFDKADLIVSFGADFLGTWVSPVEFSAQWAKNRKLAGQDGAKAHLSKLVVFESTMTITGAAADQRIAIRPSEAHQVALAIAHDLIVSRKVSRFAGDGAVQSALASYTPEAVATETGIEGGAARIREMARDLWAARGKSLVVGGGLAARTPAGSALQVAVNLLNSALENEGVTVDGTANTRAAKSGTAAFRKLMADLNAGQVDVLILNRVNPLFTLPTSGFDKAMAKAGMVIAIADRIDETAAQADLVLADHHSLENWGDHSPRRGLRSLQQPTIAPLHDTRSFQDNLLSWVKGSGKAAGLALSSVDWHTYLQSAWKDVFAEAKPGGSFEQFWEGSLRAGVLVTPTGRPSARAFRAASLSAVPKFNGGASHFPLQMALYESIAMGDGANANNPWAQELPDPVSSVTWDNFLNVAPKTAEAMNIQENDVVLVDNGNFKAELPVHVQPGMHPGVVSSAVGWGRRAVGKVGNGAGVDVFPFASWTGDTLAFSGGEVKISKTGRVYRLAATQWHFATENRPVINDITLADYKKNPAHESHTDPHLRLSPVPTLWPTHTYAGYRWGMAIDLNSCTGCGACMIACQAENNIPVVGRDQVRVSRIMHWIRIDRYYSGSVDNPDVIFQPMMCQHCENAPCETVCPVLATMHDHEGLNVQAYNRCVGTRYCQNNCPYKVRRFNFFDHWKNYEGTMNLAWNPDITVRTRGIMEKCTFCVQRIRDAKDKAKDQGVVVADGSFKTACQQTCPTEAIVFGNVNDAQSKAQKMRTDPRAFRSLEILNAKPMISYLTKVRNKAASAHGGGEHHG